MDGVGVTWSLIKDNFEQARSHEELRAKTVSLTLTIGSIFVAALAIDGFASKTIDLFGKPIAFQTLDGLCLITVGIFGALCSQKHYERNRMHIAMAQQFLIKLHESDANLLPFDTAEVFAEFKRNGKWKAKWAKSIELNLLWTGFPLILAVVGLILFLSS